MQPAYLSVLSLLDDVNQLACILWKLLGILRAPKLQTQVSSQQQNAQLNLIIRSHLLE